PSETPTLADTSTVTPASLGMRLTWTSDIVTGPTESPTVKVASRPALPVNVSPCALERTKPAVNGARMPSGGRTDLSNPSKALGSMNNTPSVHFASNRKSALLLLLATSYARSATRPAETCAA